jgi:APA family basic amino acid/polyamine antiporter
VFLIWVAAAFLFYFFYSRHHSHLGRDEHVGLAAEDNEP